MLVALAFEQCLRKPGARVLYLAPWSKDAVDIVRDIAAHLLPDCPDDLKPEFGTQNREYTFRNGSLIRFKGTNGEHAQFLRGGEADLIILDECGTMDDLDSVINDVVTPMVMRTDGRVIMATTPSLTPEHPSHGYFERAMRDGAGYEFTLLDAPETHLSRKQKARTLEAIGEKAEDIDAILDGRMTPKTTAAQREYFCMWVTDASAAVVPEFDRTAQAEITREWPRPPFRDCYVSMDPGMTDRTGILFAYVDARAGKLVIEDELLLNGADDRAGTQAIAAAIKAKERELWSDGAGPPEVFMRICDTNEPHMIADLVGTYGLPFTPALKRDSNAAIWNMRQMVANRTLVIHPRCVNLIRQLRNAVFNKKATDFERLSGESEKLLGHFDLVAALKYLCRMVVWQRNPYPAYYREPGQAEPLRTWRESPDPNPLPVQSSLAKKMRRRGLA